MSDNQKGLLSEKQPKSVVEYWPADPTQRGDDIAAEMRAYFDTHKNDKWQRGTADNLMLGLANIVARAIEATRPTDMEVRDAE